MMDLEGNVSVIALFAICFVSPNAELEQSAGSVARLLTGLALASLIFSNFRDGIDIIVYQIWGAIFSNCNMTQVPKYVIQV